MMNYMSTCNLYNKFNDYMSTCVWDRKRMRELCWHRAPRGDIVAALYHIFPCLTFFLHFYDYLLSISTSQILKIEH